MITQEYGQYFDHLNIALYFCYHLFIWYAFLPYDLKENGMNLHFAFHPFISLYRFSSNYAKIDTQRV